MNLVECVVTKVISKEPRFKHGKYWVTVERDSYGVLSNDDVMFETVDDANNVKPGDKYLS